jgi:hypothetical protein
MARDVRIETRLLITNEATDSDKGDLAPRPDALEVPLARLQILSRAVFVVEGGLLLFLRDCSRRMGEEQPPRAAQGGLANGSGLGSYLRVPHERGDVEARRSRGHVRRSEDEWWIMIT